MLVKLRYGNLLIIKFQTINVFKIHSLNYLVQFPFISNVNFNDFWLRISVTRCLLD